MTDPTSERALDLAVGSIVRHEGWRSLVYDDKTGKTVPNPTPGGALTIGYGFNLSVGITKTLGAIMLRYYLDVAALDAVTIFSAGWEKCDATRRAVLIEMSYQLGGPRLSGFRDLRAAVAEGRWPEAVAAMLDSAWARQVPGRAEALSMRMLHGDAIERMT